MAEEWELKTCELQSVSFVVRAQIVATFLNQVAPPPSIRWPRPLYDSSRREKKKHPIRPDEPPRQPNSDCGASGVMISLNQEPRGSLFQPAALCFIRFFLFGGGISFFRNKLHFRVTARCHCTAERLTSGVFEVRELATW